MWGLLPRSRLLEIFEPWELFESRWEGECPFSKISHMCVCVYIYICSYMKMRMYVSYTCIRIYVYIHKLLVPVLKRALPDFFKRQATSFRANASFHLSDSGSAWWERNKELWTKTCNHSGYKPLRRTNFATNTRFLLKPATAQRHSICKSRYRSHAQT